MKFYKIMIVSIFLLAIISLGAVSASDLTTANNEDSLSSFNDFSLNDNANSLGDCPELSISSQEIDKIDSSNVDLLDESVDVANSENKLLGESDIKTQDLDSDLNASMPDIKIYEKDGRDYVKCANDTVIIELPKGINGNYTILLNGEIYPEIHINKDGEMDSSNWYQEGNKIYVDIHQSFQHFNITFNFSGNEKYFPCSLSKDFKTKYSIEYSESADYKDGKVFISLLMPFEANGSFIILVDDEIYEICDIPEPTEFEDNDVAFLVSYSYNLTMGKHNVYAYYNGSDNDTFGVEPVNFTIDVSGKIHMYGLSAYEYSNRTPFSIVLVLPEDAVGTLYVSSGNYTASKPVNNGQTVSIPVLPSTLGVGLHEVIAYYDSDDDKGYNVPSIKFNVGVLPNYNFNYGADVFNGKISANAQDKNQNGIFGIILDGKKNYTVKLKDGRGTIKLPILQAGGHSYQVFYYDNNGNFSINPSYNGFTLEKAKSPKLVASDLSMFYKDGSAFKVKVWDVDGKVIKGASVVIKINNKKVKTVKTNANGIAAFKIAHLPKTYKISATFAKVSISKKLTVRQPLALKTVKVKRSAKYLVLTAVLKGKKPYVGKRLIFRFNGKNYAAKTNKKGIAKVVIKKSVLKRLKLGRKMVYQVSFSKDTVKKIAKVIR